MTGRTVRYKNASQIVFDITGGEKEYLTMSLRTIPNRPKIEKSANERDFTLRTDDIEGASYRPPRIYNHNNFQYDVSDIEGTSSKSMFDKTKKPVDIMNVNDIEGARPYVQRNMPHSNRMTNPLDPQYKLASYKEEPAPKLRFIRDNINVDDIEGTHTKAYYDNKPPKDIMKIDDIQGSHPRKRTFELNGVNRDTLNVSDINNDGIFRSSRRTDPQNPVYLYDGQKIEATDYGRKFPPRHQVEGRNYSLTTKDIEGAQADTSTQWYRTFKAPPPPPPPEEEEFKPDMLMLPSMKKQTQLLESQEMLRKYRGERLRYNENRSLYAQRGTGDPIQAMLRQQRENKNRSRRNDHVASSTTRISIQ